MRAFPEQSVWEARADPRQLVEQLPGDDGRLERGQQRELRTAGYQRIGSWWPVIRDDADAARVDAVNLIGSQQVQAGRAAEVAHAPPRGIGRLIDRSVGWQVEDAATLHIGITNRQDDRPQAAAHVVESTAAGTTLAESRAATCC